MIVGICGKAGTGKTTAANALVEQLGATRLPLARQVKLDTTRILAELYGAQAFKVWDEDRALAWVERHKAQLRPFLQALGTDLVRGLVDNDYWVNVLIDRIDRSTAWEGQERLWVVDDVRFQNEAEAIRRAGGVIVKLHSDDLIRKSRLRMDTAQFIAMNSHVSETGVDAIEATVTIDSGGTALALQEETVRVVKQLVRALS